MFEFWRNRPVTTIIAAYFIFAWSFFAMHISFGWPPFKYGLLFGILILAAISDTLGITQANLGYKMIGSVTTPAEFNLLVALGILILIVYLLEIFSEKAHNFIEEHLLKRARR